MARTTKGIGKSANVTRIGGKVTDISKAKADVSKAKVGKQVIRVVALPVTFTLPKGGMFIASWARVSVKIDPASGLKMDDLRFEVKEGPHAGQVSPCRDRLYDPAKPNIMLIAGPRAGKFTLEAFKKGAAKAVGSAQFTVTNLWTKADTGASSARWAWSSGRPACSARPGAEARPTQARRISMPTRQSATATSRSS